MIVERVEQLFALIQGQRILSHPGWSHVNFATLIPPVVVILGLALIVDYGYMIYLHFQMASPQQYQTSHLIATLTLSYSHQVHSPFP